MSRDISIVTELFEPHVGGQENRFARFAEALAGLGHEVTVYTSDPTGGSLPVEAVVRGVKVVRYIAMSGYVRNGSRGLGPLLRYRQSTRELLGKLLRAGGPVWVNEMPVVHLAGRPEADGLGIDWCEYPTYWMVNLLARRLAQKVNRGTAVSPAVADHLRSINPDIELEVIRTPVSVPSDPDPIREPGTIVYVGRIVGHKNIGALAKAVQQFRSDGRQSARLIVAGDGPDRPVLKDQFGRNGVVSFVGPVSEEEKRRLIRSSWLLAVPGTREGFPTVAAEANVYGTPLLASGSPRNSTGDFIRENDVGVVAPGSRAADFLEALRSIDESSWDRWTARSTQLRSLYDPSVNAHKLEAALGRWAG